MMKAISLWQPWASLIAIGAKKIETRSWPTKYRGPLAIHAAKRPFNTDLYLDRELHVFAEALELPDIYSFDELPYGAVIATCNLKDCWQIVSTKIGAEDVSPKLKIPGTELIAGATIGLQEYYFGDYTPGRFVWRLGDIKQLPEPIPARGMQGLWDWEPAKGVLLFRE